MMGQENNFESCKEKLSNDFISDGIDYNLDVSGKEKSIFHITFLGNTIYRLITCTEIEEIFILNLYDKDYNHLFSSNKFVKSAFWDFEFNVTLNCIIEIEPVNKKKMDGKINFLVGFKQL